MAYYKDLTPCKYYDSEHFPIGYKNVLSVGWIDKLENGELCDFTKQPKNHFGRSLFAHLRLVNSKFGRDFFKYCGWHNSAIDQEHMYGEIFIPGDGVIYAAPAGIIHYMEENGYLPPTDFIEAVMSLDYKISFKDYMNKIREIDERFFWLLIYHSDLDHSNDEWEEKHLPWYYEHKEIAKQMEIDRLKNRSKKKIEYDKAKEECAKMSTEELTAALSERFLMK